MWDLCMWQADTEQTTTARISFLRMQCMQQNEFFYAMGLIKCLETLYEGMQTGKA